MDTSTESLKTEAIKNAYGQYWEEVEEFVNVRGWLDAKSWLGSGGNSIVRSKMIGIELECWNDHHPKYCYLFRPVSLDGLEKNNGWKKIHSSADLPTENGLYWVIDKFMETNPCQEYWNGVALISFEERWMYRFSHYQPVEVPKMPII